jgi:hypothetical protein
LEHYLVFLFIQPKLIGLVQFCNSTFRPKSKTSEWFILRSEDLSFFAAPFGANGDIPVAGDYDGDNKFDLAVFRPTNVTWFILKSTGGTQIQAFGAAGDKPVPSAFVP